MRPNGMNTNVSPNEPETQNKKTSYKSEWPSSPCPDLGTETANKVRKREREEARRQTHCTPRVTPGDRRGGDLGSQALARFSCLSLPALRSRTYQAQGTEWVTSRVPAWITLGEPDSAGLKKKKKNPLATSVSTEKASGEVAGTCCLRQEQRNSYRSFT